MPNYYKHNKSDLEHRRQVIPSMNLFNTLVQENLGEITTYDVINYRNGLLEIFKFIYVRKKTR